MRKKKEEIRTYKRVIPDIHYGLTKEQLLERENDKNIVEKKTGKSYGQIIFGNFFTFFNMLMITIAVLFLVLIGPSTIGNMGFMVILIINLLIGTIQECKSKRIIEKLKLTTESKIKVLREGIEKEIDAKDIVVDDILFLQIGAQIPVDCIIMEGAVDVNEALLTGESVAVKKKTGDELFAGAFIISGACTARADKIGNNTYIQSIESKAKGFKKPKSKLMESISRIIKFLTIIVVPIGILIFWNTLIHGEEPTKALLAGGTSIIGMIPCGMMLLSSLAMATGVIKLSNKKTLVQDLYSVESLSRIDTLCLDKTGTLTDGTMTVEKTIEFGVMDVDSIIKAYLGAFKTENQTSLALIKKYGQSYDKKVLNVLEFSSARKYSAVEFEDGVYALGAPEFLVNDEDILAKAEDAARNGIRSVLLVKVNGKIYDDGTLSKRRSPIALFLIRDNIRTEVRPTMEWFAENDVDIKVISGDNPSTVSYIAKQSGIKNWDKVVDMSTVDEKDLEELVIKNSIFGRVSPEQKAQIVDILKKNGRTVGITGDGINDILAMKKSDCAVALENGVPATKNIANIVLMDSNFSNMKEAVLEGRRVVNNIQRSTTLFLMKDFFFMFMSIFSILIGVNFPIETSVMSVINIFITGVTSFLIALEPSSARISGSFMRNVLGKGIVAGAFLFTPGLFLFIYAFIKCGINIAAVNEFIANWVPILAICITVAGYVVFFNVSKPFTRYRRWLFGIVLAITIVVLLAVPELFLNNSTVYWGEMFSQHDTFKEVLEAIVGGIFSLRIYRDFTKEQWLMIGIFTGTSFILYRVVDYFVSRFLNITMFNEHRFIDK